MKYDVKDNRTGKKDRIAEDLQSNGCSLHCGRLVVRDMMPMTENIQAERRENRKAKRSAGAN